MRRYRPWLLVLVTGLLVPIITNLASSWLEANFGQTPNRLLQLLALGVFVVAVLSVLARVLREKEEPLVLVPRDARPAPMPGLIALVGRGRPGEKPEPGAQAAARAIEYHLAGDTLKVCWLVASTGEKGSIGMAREIQHAYESRCKVIVCPAGDGFSLQDTYDVVQRIYNEEIYADELAALELAPERVIADFTSGTAPMTAGMVLACGRYRPMQYTTGRPARAGEAEIASVPLLVEFRPTRRRRGR